MVVLMFFFIYQRVIKNKWQIVSLFIFLDKRDYPKDKDNEKPKALEESCWWSRGFDMGQDVRQLKTVRGVDDEAWNYSKATMYEFIILILLYP